MKGELTFSVLVMAALSLIVLILLIFILTDGFSGWKKTAEQCFGECIANESTCPEGTYQNFQSDCGEGLKCCVG